MYLTVKSGFHFARTWFFLKEAHSIVLKYSTSNYNGHGKKYRKYMTHTSNRIFRNP